jgi:anaerobic selenocysteine-containing dehydrogenase
LINVENGVGSRLRGNAEHPITRGFLCGKVAKYLDREYSPHRLLHPMKRTGAKGSGEFSRISWDEALDGIAERLAQVSREHGPESILPYSYGGTMGFLQGSGMDRRFFHRLGASQLDRTICSAAGMAGMNATLGGLRYGTEPEQFRHSKLIVAWGANILGTNVHLWPFILEAKRNGARFYTIDPVENRTTKLADRHYGIYPGSDLALALGLMHMIIGEKRYDSEYVESYTQGFGELRQLAAQYPPERTAALTGIGAPEIVSLAREYATTKPAAIRLNYGVQRSERGGSAVRAIAMLPALIGSWRLPGGGIQLSTSQAFQLNRAALERPDLQKKSPLGRPARVVNMSTLGKALTELADPPVKALVVYNSNPAAVAPNQGLVRRGLGREELFTAVLEQFQTDTADYADYVLPVTTFLEHTDIYFAYGHYYLQLARPALPAPGETKSNVDIFRLLAERMGLDEPALRETEDEMIRALLDSRHPFLDGITLEELDRKHFLRLRVSKEGEPFLPFASGGFGGPEGRCDLRSEGLDYTPPIESRLGNAALAARFPLEMVSSKNDDSMNSTFGYEAGRDSQTAALRMHIRDASQRKIETGDLVRVFNERGSITVAALVDGSVREGVVRLPSVRWPKMAPDRNNVNVLSSDRLTDIGAGPVFYSCLVQVERCGD